MKKKNKFELLFPQGKVPDVNEFNCSLDAMSEEGRKKFREKIYKVSFIVWTALPPSQQNYQIIINK